jgi:AbiV family abortive infection protein
VAGSDFRFTVELLREYSSVALRNADELLQEASLLYENRRTARAYFLAVASIEETGKALLAFTGQGRNLNDPAVTTKQRQVMENHSQKIGAAFLPTMDVNPPDRDEIMACVNLSIQLIRGREPSMYTDIDYATSEIQVPKARVRDIAAKNCVHIAGLCLANARKYECKAKSAIKR